MQSIIKELKHSAMSSSLSFFLGAVARIETLCLTFLEILLRLKPENEEKNGIKRMYPIGLWLEMVVKL